ncbi:MAG: DUF763 domain-containing protein [Chloroflexota bacterium]|nr:DUF763 domain-containing protein [Chloroflexota bacterium]
MKQATRTGVANLPLHGGKAPRWLFERMTKLSREISIAIVAEFGPEEMLHRLSDPFWFQGLGCVLGFDWHSSGVTTTVCGALKEGTKGLENELGFYVAGGKGKASRQTPAQITQYSELISRDPAPLVYASKMSAKVDSCGVQDGYQLYHHVFLFTAKGDWAVIQQGMNETNRYARRYHWLSEDVTDFVREPHAAICSQGFGDTLNMVAEDSEGARDIAARVATEESPETIVRELNRLKSLNLPSRHYLTLQDLHPERLEKIFTSTYEHKPEGFENLMGMAGVGPKTIRALSLISELVWGVAPSFNDPARYSFAHGGKDGIPYPVDRKTYDRSIDILAGAIREAKLGNREEMEALRRLHTAFPENE